MVLLCSIADVRSRTTSALIDDAIGALIESVSDYIEDYVGAWLAPRPADPALTTTYLFDVETAGSTLRLVRNGRLVGIRTLTSLGTATSGQPETGGTYTTATLANVLLRPRPTYEEGPATTLVLTSGYFSRGFNTVSATGSLGPATVSSRAREATIQLCLLTEAYHPGLTQLTIGAWSETYASNSAWNQSREREAILSALTARVIT